MNKKKEKRIGKDKKVRIRENKLTEKYENGKNKVCILGTYYFYLLDEKKTKNDYYYFFLEIVNSLFKKQWENINIYGTAPQCIHEVNKLIKGFNQANMLV